ncbi:lipoprotein LpqH [Nocardioides daejeonensis]|uniref:lipoprotein LpqH n=1 Tax=Nocardioides daejeonensis TaxID=1046556 RepID=UPI000D750484|nr:lipoprotein LpqH [Nocardioides daejeonensis]
MRITKILVSGVAVLALAGGLTACGDDTKDDKKDDSSQTTPEAPTDDAPAEDEGTDEETATTDDGSDPEVSSGGDISVKVDGKEVSGLDTSTIQCAKMGGKINVGSADAGSGLGLVMTDEATPKVESFGLLVDGITLAVAPGMGSADVAVDGNTYTITGTAQGTDSAKPTEVVEKDFEIVVTCD